MRFLLPLFLVLSCAPALANELTTDQWRQDLKVLATELPKRHKNLFFQLPKADFDREVKDLDESIPKLSDLEIRAGLMRLVASIGNAHTTIDAFRGMPDFPIWFSFFDDGVYVTGAPQSQPQLLGSRLLAVNGISVEEVRRRLLPFMPMENDVEPLRHSDLLHSAAALKSVGVIAEMDKAAFTLQREGTSFVIELHSAQQVPMIKDSAGFKLPLFRSRWGLDYWYEYLPDAKTMYVQYNACRNMKQQSFADFTAEVMKTVDSSPIDRFVVDLRFNGGGNSDVIRPLIEALSSRHRLRVFAIVGINTFSSGFIAALDLQKNCHAFLVGQAMGQRPNAYGDTLPLKLPNSGLTVTYSTKFFRYVEEGDPAHIEPDVRVANKAADHFGGRDPILDYILSH